MNQDMDYRNAMLKVPSKRWPRISINSMPPSIAICHIYDHIARIYMAPAGIISMRGAMPEVAGLGTTDLIS